MTTRAASADVGLAAASTLLAAWTVALEVHPSQDGGAHAHTAAMLRAWVDGVGSAREVFAFAWVPNVVAPAMIAALSYAMSYAAAERVVAVAAAVAVVAGVRAWVRAVGAPAWAAWAALPLIFGQLFVLGFHNFLLGLGAGFAMMAAAVAGRGGAVAAWSLAASVLHPMAFVLAMPGVLITGVRPKVWAGVLPGVAVVAAFAGGHRAPAVWAWQGRALVALVNGAAWGAAPGEWLPVALWWWAVLLAGLWAARVAVRAPALVDRVGGVGLGWVLASLVAPSELASGAFVPDRMLLCGSILWAVWACARTSPWLAVGSLATAVATTALRVSPWRDLDGEIGRLAQVRAHLRAGELVMAVHPGRPPLRPHLGLHGAGWLLADVGAIDLSNYQPATTHFPLVYRPGWDPRGALGAPEDFWGDPSKLDYARYRSPNGRPIEAVLVWGRDVDAIASIPGYAVAFDAPGARVFRPKGGP